MVKEQLVHPTILEAVEALSDIAFLEMDRDLETSQKSESPSISVIQWLQEHDSETSILMIKEIFQVILNYLKNYSKNHYILTQKDTEGIKAIMVLVGEAAKNLDKFTDLFRDTKIKSITDLKEYQRLQDFYLTRIARKIDEGLLSKWIMALSQQVFGQRKEMKETAPSIPVKHIFVEIDAVKKDEDYELFFIRKEDGSRFFSPRLIRNIKLVCDFGDRLSKQSTDDPLESVLLWRDKAFLEVAKNILDFASSTLRQFYHYVAVNKPESELSFCLGKSLMALMLCSNPHNLSNENPGKNCSEYFADFHHFLREALRTTEYQKLLGDSGVDKRPEAILLKLSYTLCHGLFAASQWNVVIAPFVANLIQESTEAISAEHKKVWQSSKNVSDRILSEHSALTRYLKQIAYRPLVKVLDVLENGDYNAFDPLVQDNIPNLQFSVESGENKIRMIRMPSPTHQEYIHKVVVADEFKGFLFSLVEKQREQKFLLINFQDRTSWKEHKRSNALEELQKHPNFSKQLCVVTLPKDTEFYYQDEPYGKENHASAFIKSFREHLEDESCGFYFPEKIKSQLFPKFIDGILKGVHELFFGGRNVLPKERRLDFIEIVYLLIELKLLEIVEPNIASLVCKDGVDTGPASSALLYIFLKMLEKKEMSSKDIEELNTILYAPALMIRERVIAPDSIMRMIAALKEIELCQNELGWEQFNSRIKELFGDYIKCL